MWDPDKYLAFADHRERPVHDLLARIGAPTARRVVDLGCGAGNLVRVLSRRWPEAAVEAIDSSPQMVETARADGIDAQVLDVRDWRPSPDTDVVVCNAVLHWIPEHPQLLQRWVSELPAGAWFAFQVPGNFTFPSHRAALDLVAGEHWRDLDGLLLDADCVRSAAEYAQLLADAGCRVDAWETTYVQSLAGENPVLEWLTGSTLRPVRDVLDESRWQRFCSELAPSLRTAYPARPDGTTLFPFRRVFAVAQRR